jgi:hypothetical protein
MIEFNFKGGLGNQMFQYAFYLHLKKLYPQTKFLFDTDCYRYENFHTGFELARVFPACDVKFDRRPYSFVEKGYYKLKANIKKRIYRLMPWIEYITEENADAKLLNGLSLNKRYFVKSTWYSDKYFTDVQDDVKEVFRFDNNLTEENKMLLYDIERSNSVSMHVRRGDFISLNVERIPLSESNFYKCAVNKVFSKIGEGKIFIFSDEPEWCRANMTFLQNHEHEFVTNNQGDQSFRDMQLMSRCKHNIIANSSFSWWAAFLNPNPDKIVICPAILDDKGRRREDIHHRIYCDDWIKI